MRYANDELPQAGDRIRNSKGRFGTVTKMSRVRDKKSGPSWITVKWDEGVVDIEYDLASDFTLVSRTPSTGGSLEIKAVKSE